MPQQDASKQPTGFKNIEDVALFVAGIGNEKLGLPEKELDGFTKESVGRPLRSSANIVGMQTLLKRYSQCLPQPTGQAVSSTGPNAVAVIGSTGFLGPHIVASLLRNHVGSKVFCLNRGADGEQRTISALRGIIGDISSSLSRLQFLVTNITEPNFGLEAAQVTLLASEVDEVVFNAWDSNWSLPLEHFRPFLTAICNAVNFCASSATRPRIIFVSSITGDDNTEITARGILKVVLGSVNRRLDRSWEELHRST